MYIKQSLIVMLLLVSVVLKAQNLSEQLITIHRVANQTTMNAIANPDNLSLVYVDSEQLTYQYVDGAWVPLSSENNQNIIDSLIIVAQYYNLLTDSCCGVNTSNPVLYEVGDTLACGVIFYIDPNWVYALVCAVEQFSSTWGCGGVMVNSNSVNDGQANTNTIVTSPCYNSTMAAGICQEYSICGYTDWYLGSRNELRYLLTNIDAVNATINSLGGTEVGAGALFSINLWTSQEQNANSAWAINLQNGQIFPGLSTNKTSINQPIRPIRKHIF